jgi:hypothetical protein
LDQGGVTHFIKVFRVSKAMQFVHLTDSPLRWRFGPREKSPISTSALEEVTSLAQLGIDYGDETHHGFGDHNINP